MAALVISILALFVGALVVEGLGRWRSAVGAIDAFVLAAVGGLVFLHLLPHSLEMGGAFAAGAALVGLLLPVVGEHALFGGSPRQTGQRVVLAFALAGLSVHAFLDGAALSAHASGPHAHDHSHHDALLAVGVILHRVPIGLALWTTVYPRRGRRTALQLVGVIAVATIAGFGAGSAGLHALPDTAYGVFQALVAGSLVHVVYSHPLGADVGEQAPLRERLAAAAGVLLALGLLIGLTASHGVVHHLRCGASAFDTLRSLSDTAALPLLLALVLTALLRAPLARAARTAPRAARAVVHALLHARPFRARHAAAPSAWAIAASSALGLEALLVSVPLLGAELAGARFAFAFVLAGGIALIFRPRPDQPPAPADAPEGALWPALVDRASHALPWLAAGLVTAAFVEALVDPALLSGSHTAAAALACALAALPLAIPPLALVPVAAVLLHKGLPPSAAMVLLLLGPVAGASALRALARSWSTPRVGLLALAAASLALGAGYLTQALGVAARAPDLHALAEPVAPLDAVWPWAVAVAVLLGAAVLVARGPRALLLELVGEHHDHHHAHCDHSLQPLPQPDPAP